MIRAAILGLLMTMTGLPAAHAASEPLAEVDGAAITAEEVETALAPQLTKLEEQVYNLKRQKVEALIAERLLAGEAARRGISVPALFAAEVMSKVGLVSEQEIEDFYRTNKARLMGEEATVRDQIRAHLQNQKLAVQRDAFLQSLRSRAKVVVNLKAPPVFRATVSTDGAPFKGPEGALVTIVEFQDFHCPFCKQVQPTLGELLSKYGNKVKLVHRDFPIDQLHPQARKLHEAARCANDQGKFWAYYDLLYAKEPAKPDQVSIYAQEIGLDLPAFEQCVSSGRYQAAVQKDIEQGTRAGVAGTPAFFINGRLLSGAQPLDRFVQIIEDELARIP